MAIHLHRDYHFAECGIDASHVAMTYEEEHVTCKACITAKPQRLADEKAEFDKQVEESLAKQALEKAEFDRLNAEREKYVQVRSERRKARQNRAST